MRYYLKTTDRKYIESYKQLAKMARDREKHVLKLARTWGFDVIGMDDFSDHVAFFRLATKDDRKRRVGPPIEGFRACRKNPQAYHNGRFYFRYYFHGRNKLATELQKQLKAGMPPRPEELKECFRRPTVASAFSVRHGLPDGHFTGNKILYSMIYLLRGDIIVMSLPVTNEEVVIPDNCEEITERAWGAEIDKHNTAIKEPSHDNQ